MKNISLNDLKFGKEISFRYEDRIINDGVSICIENGVEDLGKHGNPQPDVPFPRLRLMFAGSTFGRFDISKISELRELK